MSQVTASTELFTSRLRLRWLTGNDAESMLSLWNDPAFIRHVGDRGIRSVSEARAALRDGILRLYADSGYGPYLIEPRVGGALMGICGLFKRERLDYPDLGYSLLPEFRGRGFALEAAREVMVHARDHLVLRKLLAIVSPGNTPSIRLLQTLGMRPVKTSRMAGMEEDVLLYQIVFHGEPGSGVGNPS